MLQFSIDYAVANCMDGVDLDGKMGPSRLLLVSAVLTVLERRLLGCRLDGTVATAFCIIGVDKYCS